MDVRQLISRLLLGVAFVPMLSEAGGKCERLIVTGSPDAPPYLWRDPADPAHLIGVSADLVKQAAQALGITVEVLYSGKRSQAQEEVRSGRMDMLIDAPLTLAGLTSLDYIHPPLVRNDYVVWTRKDSALVYDTPADLQGYKGALSDKARPTEAFEAFATHQLTLERQPGLTQALHKLQLGQVEYVIAGRYAGMATAQTLGIADDVVAHSQPIDQPGLFLAISHDSACNEPWLRGQLAKKMTELPTSGVAEAALQRNLERWKAQQ
ncbi:ABC transporter substrate-binding protein [Pseudomonas sp.]|uniref:substrate-binding periplasmic protein n=1 Tax=Pseudomonas sp. TaxID=306 RepID=UPI002635CDEC|nr:transporter substrate-binding domain-containing protein [Pseudomonas sp.]